MVKGKDTIQKKRTRAVDACTNPIYNETLAFDVPHSHLDSVTYMISVTHKNGRDTGVRDLSERVIGSCSLGPASYGTGYDHWMDMVQSPRKATAKWHPLR